MPLPDLPPWGNAFVHVVGQCGTHPMPDWWVVVWFWEGRLAIPTKTPLAIGQLSGRQCSFWRVLLQVLTRLAGRALLRYFFLHVSMQLHSSLLFMVAVWWFMTSLGVRCLSQMLLSLLRSLLQHSFHKRKAHSDAVM